MKKITFYLIAFLLLMNVPVTNAQIDLLNNSTEDGSFSTYTIDQTNFFTPTLKPGVGFWDADGTKGGTRTSVRVHNTTTNPNYHSAYHYLQVLMDNGSLGSNYIWRKISELTPGATYTFSFYYKIPHPHILTDRSVKFGVTDDITNINVNETANEVNTLTNLLGGQLLDFSNTAGTGEPYTQASYTFTVPAGKTEIYAVWLRSHSVDRSGTGTMRVWLDDMSLYLGVTSSTNPLQSDNTSSVYPNPVKDYLNIKSTKDIKQIMITDLTGRMVMNVADRNFTGVDVSSLQNGSYLIQLIGEETTVQRFIKK
jgi:hypothetical protein